MRWLCWLAFLVCEKAIAFDTITTYDGASFMNYVPVGQDETLLRCELMFDTQTVTINVDSSSAIQDEIFGGRLYSLGRGICGFKVVKASRNDPNKFAFNVITKGASNTLINNTHEFKVDVQIIDKNPVDDKQVELTRLFDLQYTMNRQIASCTIYKPSGKIAIENNQCKYSAKQATMEDVGQWTLEIGLKNRMKPMRVHFNAALKAVKAQRMWYEEKDGYGLIGCNYTIILNKKYTKCIFTKPDKSIFLVTNTFASERYTAIGSDLDAGIVQIQFKLPLTNSEIGRWTCRFDYGISEFIDVGQPSRAKLGALETYEKHINKIIHLEKPFEILCSVPYPIENCFIKGPNGTIYNMDPTSNNNLGECLFKIESGKEEDKGVWTCYLSNPDNIEDEIIIIQVEISNELKASENQLDVLIGDSVTMLFKRPIPIDTCYCISPVGTTYFLSETKTQGNVVYQGKGLHVGECGMRIEKAEAEYGGVWECFSKIRSYEQDIYSSQIRLTIIEQTLMGISVGVPVAISIAAIFIISLIVYYWYKQTKERRNDEDENRSSLSSQHSDTLFIIDSPLQRN